MCRAIVYDGRLARSWVVSKGILWWSYQKGESSIKAPFLHTSARALRYQSLQSGNDNRMEEGFRRSDCSASIVGTRATRVARGLRSVAAKPHSASHPHAWAEPHNRAHGEGRGGCPVRLGTVEHGQSLGETCRSRTRGVGKCMGRTHTPEGALLRVRHRGNESNRSPSQVEEEAWREGS